MSETYKRAQEIINDTASKRSKFRVFRGQSSSNWKLIPSIYRSNDLYDESKENTILEKIKATNTTVIKEMMVTMSTFYKICIERGIELPILSESTHRSLLNISTNITDKTDTTQVTTILPSCYWPLASTMQHLGFQTPMLDWTSDPLVALYFACSNNDEDDASVWILKTNHTEEMFQKSHVIDDHSIHFDATKRQIHEAFKKGRSSNCAFFLYRPQFTKEVRIVAQSGWLSIFGINFSEQEGFSENNFSSPEDAFDLEHVANIYADQTNQKTEDIISRINIPNELKRSIRYTLWNYGIHELSVYPGLSHIVKFTELSISRQLADTLLEQPEQFLKAFRPDTP